MISWYTFFCYRHCTLSLYVAVIVRMIITTVSLCSFCSNNQTIECWVLWLNNKFSFNCAILYLPSLSLSIEAYFLSSLSLSLFLFRSLLAALCVEYAQAKRFLCVIPLWMHYDVPLHITQWCAELSFQFRDAFLLTSTTTATATTTTTMNNNGPIATHKSEHLNETNKWTSGREYERSTHTHTRLNSTNYITYMFALSIIHYGRWAQRVAALP